MKKNIYKIVFPVFIVVLSAFTFFFSAITKEDTSVNISKLRRTGSPKAEANAKAGRDEFFTRLLMDPKTKQIPADAVRRDMEFAKMIKAKGLRKTTANDLFTWSFAGPNNVGGRTRALAIDVRNSNTILAGGVSGGIWKSTNNGGTWTFKSDLTQVLSISYLVQDTRAGHEDTWYASTGEITGNSATQYGAAFRGAGVYKSTNNGESWTLLPKTDNIITWDHPLDYISKIQVSPVTGTIFISSNGYGIFKSTDGGNTFLPVLESDARYVEIDVASNGNIVATLSEDAAGSNVVAGVYYSQNDGSTWNDVTPGTWPVGTGYKRSVIDFAPSNENIVYILTEVSDNNGDHRFHKINLSNNTSEDRSANLPAFTNGPYTSQGSYDMLLAVKPDDENFVLIGGTSLYRSINGFGSPLNDNESSFPSDHIKNSWIGGYDNDDGNGSYIESHADIHSFAFDPNDPKKVWIGHDGGVKYTSNITGLYAQDFTSTMWGLKNRDYNVTQVYHISIKKNANDGKFLIGTQDNGTPYFTFTNGVKSYLNPDISSGDGSFSYFADDYAYVSTQNGSILKLAYTFNGAPLNIWVGQTNGYYGHAHPQGSDNQLFINPFAIDPNNEKIMFYPDGNRMWRNIELDQVPQEFNWDGVTWGWNTVDQLEQPVGIKYSAMTFSKVPGEHRLYFAASDYANATASPKIYRLDNANSTPVPNAVDISISDITGFAWIHDIAVNPNNSDELIVVATNYNIIGLYHSTDAGATWTAIEGNLADGPTLGDGKGPSLRSAVILPVGNTTRYLVGTSAGLYSTLYLNGSSTVWNQEAADVVGNVVVESMTSRTADNYVAIGTHGRGVFVGTAKAVVGVKQIDGLPTDYTLSQNYPNPFNPSTKIRYSVPLASNVSLKIYNSNGEEVAEVLNKYLPAGTFEADWNGTNQSGIKVASGVYFYTLRAGDFVQTKKMVMLK